jgi:UDP-2,4-diacetamido-2,4,6-trideoxy-beta-L-altropyranose hydrolase
MNLVARISTQLGIGHLMRSKWLLLELQQRGAHITLVLDENGEELSAFYTELACNVEIITPTLCDKQITAEIMKRVCADYLLIDHYDLGLSFESYIRQSVVCQIIVLDDLARKHDCDYLIDAKWDGKQTQSRYENKLPLHCQQFLGPKYALLSDQYIDDTQTNFEDKPELTVMCSMGGGGDMLTWVTLIQAHQRSSAQSIGFVVIVGPQAKNISELARFASAHSNIQLIENPKSLVPFYKSANLFIGALGTSLYELAALKIPAITFSISQNQENDILALEALGHYFHLDSLSTQDTVKLGENISVFLLNINRLKRLRSFTKIKVDGLGVKRIASKLMGSNLCEPASQELTLDNIEREALSGCVSIRKVADADVNRYLIARNLPNNADKMTVSKEIPRLGHYIWWLSNNRQSFVIEKEGVPVIYIWHDLYNGKYLYGGWFTCEGNVSLPEAMLALQWQLKHCKQVYPNATWLAVIHKENRFVNLLNQYMGFKTTPVSSAAYLSTKAIFPHVDEKFNLVMLENNEE